MARVVIYLRDQEMHALQDLAQSEYRLPKAQAALIIRRELQRLGMIPAPSADGPTAEDRALDPAISPQTEAAS